VDRDTFIERVTGAMASAALPPAPEVPRRLPELPSGDLVELFTDRARAAGAVVHGLLSRHGAPRVVAEIAERHGVSTFMAWEDLPAAGVVSTLISAGLTRIDDRVPRWGSARTEALMRLRQVDLGVTGAEVGLAESGSFVLVHGPERSRLASLLPAVHIALVDSDTLTRSLAHWAAQEPGRVSEATNTVVVTGPSRSGDIELELNLGVHGPRHVHVVLID
jgi:L-lactate dehydrogenase complex protein LldG